MTGEERYAELLTDVIYDTRREHKRVMSDLDATLGTLAKLTTSLTRARDRLVSQYLEIEERLDEVEPWSGDPLVLVRQSEGGYGPAPYHDAAEPCGHVGDRDLFDEVLLGEAEAHGIAPCRFCGGRARKRLPWPEARPLKVTSA